MAGRTFAQINGSLLKSRKLRGCNHTAKWAYVCAHLTPLGNFVGRFNYPLVMWAQDADIDTNELREVIAKLQKLGLVEYDYEEEMLRIVGFIRQRPPDNASLMKSMMTDLAGDAIGSGPCEEMRLANIAEFVVGSLVRAMNWKPDSADRPKLREELGPFLRLVFQEHGEALLDALIAELETAGKGVKQELESLLPPIMDLGIPTACPHGGDTLSTQETKTRRDLDTEKDREKEKDLDDANSNFGDQSFEDIESRKVELLRKAGTGGNRGAQRGPTAATKRSRLVSGIKSTERAAK